MTTLATIAFLVSTVPVGEVRIERDGSRAALRLGEGPAFHRSLATIENLEVTRVPGTSIRVITWDETTPSGRRPHFAVSLDGRSVQRVAETTNRIRTVHGEFDPLESELELPPGWRADGSVNTYIVQFVGGQTLNEFRFAIEEGGAKILQFLPDNAYIAIVPPDKVGGIRSLPFMRWVGKLDPGLRMPAELRRELATDRVPTRRYDISVGGDDPILKRAVATKIELLGGREIVAPDKGQMIEAVLDPETVAEVAAIDGVLFVQPWGEPGTDMDIVRVVSGANHVEWLGGYRGEGLSVHVIDTGILRTHVDYASRLVVRGNPSVDSHGTSTFGIMVGNGTGNPAGRGMLPLAQGVFLALNTNWTGAQRLAITEETVNVFRCVVETNSWGNPWNWSYDAIASYMDEIIFKTDLTIFQSMSNRGNTQGRPQCWAKNIVGVGAVNHYNNTVDNDDQWAGGATIGPAPDGRIKPDMAFYYDNIFCPTSSSNNAYTSTFGGTSAATPMTAGSAALVFEMWHDGIFGNSNLGATVFANRMRNATARALLINRAYLYPNTQLDIERRVQGWGRANVRNLYDARDSIFVVDGTDLLQQLQTRVYSFNVATGTPDLKATMVYTDYWGAPLSNPNRVNALSMKVTSPSGVVYWANNGMGGNGNANANDLSNWTLPGGAPETLNTIQNVFVQNPEPGKWTLEIRAENLPQDGWPATPEIDQPYSLVVTGVRAQVPTSAIAAWRPGNLLQGGVAQAFKSDRQAVLLGPPLTTGSGGILESGLVSTHVLPFTNLGELTVVAETQSTISSTPIRILLWNAQTSQWESFDVGTAGSGKSVRKVKPADALRFVDSSGTVRVAVVFLRDSSVPAAVAWRNEVDHVRLFVSPL